MISVALTFWVVANDPWHTRTAFPSDSVEWLEAWQSSRVERSRLPQHGRPDASYLIILDGCDSHRHQSKGESECVNVFLIVLLKFPGIYIFQA